METPSRKTLIETGVVTASARGRTATRSWMCRALDADGSAREVGLGARAIVVGADRHCDLILTDPEVSRRHAELQATPEGVRVRDLNSTNGTFWQGSRVTEVVVPPGTRIRFGGTEVQVLANDTPTLPPSSRTRFGGLVGRSAAMRELFAVLELASPTDATILIEGESGTGKELIARAAHDHSPRASAPLVIVDCSSLQDHLFDSQLFGHVRGAFTGATSDRKGAFVEASGGTIFLDEIGELPLDSQTKLLRALEDQTVQPLGSDRRTTVDTRVVAATHRNLADLVAQKQFRFDLFYRLAVVHVHSPPLRARPEDIGELVQHFYEGRSIDPGPISGPNLARLEQHPWPGNVRELRNVLERAWALSGPAGAEFSQLKLWMQASAGSTDVTPGVDTSLPFKDAKERWVEEFERRYVSQVFARSGDNITRAAEAAGLGRRHMRTLLRKHGIIDS